jgi:hypothetical protein
MDAGKFHDTGFLNTASCSFAPRSDLRRQVNLPHESRSTSFVGTMSIMYTELDFKMEEPYLGRTTSYTSSHRSTKREILSVSNEQAELQEDLNKISSIRDLFVKQSQALTMMRSEDPTCSHLGGSTSYRSQARSTTSTWAETAASLGSPGLAVGKSFEEKFDVTTEMFNLSSEKPKDGASPTGVTELGIFIRPSLAGIERALDFDDESEDMDSTRLSRPDGSESDIQVAINRLRKEASQIDVIMALDSLKTVEAELVVTTRTLLERSAQVEDLRSQMEKKQETMAGLELERDLYKADAAKLKEDLQNCMDRMLDISTTAGNSFLPATTTEVAPQERWMTPRDKTSRGQYCSKAQSTFPPILHSSYFDARRRCDTREEAKKRLFSYPQTPLGQVIRKPPSKSGTSAAISSYTGKPVVAEVFSFVGPTYSREIFRRVPKSVMLPPAESINALSNMSAQIPPPAPVRRHRSFSDTALCPPGLKTDPDDDAVDGTRRCGLFRRRSSRRSIVRAEEVLAMKEKIDQLHTMMEASLEAAEKLRKRLGMITRYYEDMMTKMQHQIVEVKSENSRRKTDMDSKMALLDHEKRIAILNLETRLQLRDSEIDALKEQLFRLAHEI